MLAAASPSYGQRERKKLVDESWRDDPYTQGEKELLEAAGYASLGPFAWGGTHGTRKIEEALGELPLLWVETAHFRIGSTLPEYTPNGKDERDKIRDELKRLAERLPEVNARTRKLDRWLRLHLYAQRAEDLYAELSEVLGVTDEDFPRAPGQLVAGRYRGEGPYLGQPEKFTLLLTEKASTLGRYYERFLGLRQEMPKRHTFDPFGSLFFGTSIELAEGTLRNDTALHCHVTFNLTQNLVNGYCYYAYELPLWIPEGMAHWAAKTLDPEHSNFSQVKEFGPANRKEWNWEPKVRGRVKHDYYPAAEVLTSWTDYGRLKFSDHMMLWSRMEFLMSQDRSRFAEMMATLKGGIPGAEGAPTREQILALQQRAFEDAYGMSYEEFDEAWARHVLKTYSKK